MESDADAETLLAVAERAGAAPYVDYPPTPRWYPPATGLWAAAFVLVLTGAWGDAVVFVPGLAVLIGIELAFLAWYRRLRGTMPAIAGAPPEFTRIFRWYAVGVVAVVVAVAGARLLAGPLAAAAVTLVAVTAGLARYETVYAAAARATVDRLGSR